MACGSGGFFVVVQEVVIDKPINGVTFRRKWSLGLEGSAARLIDGPVYRPHKEPGILRVTFVLCTTSVA